MQLLNNQMVIGTIVLAVVNLILTICHKRKYWPILTFASMLCAVMAVWEEYRALYKFAAVEYWDKLGETVSVVNHQLSWFLLIVLLLNVPVLTWNFLDARP